MPKRDDLEHRAYQLIVNTGRKGILQCLLWRKLVAGGRDGSRIALKLESKNLIKREKELFKGRWTYRLLAKKRPIEIDTVLDLPCISCPYIYKCDSDSEVSPNLCKELTRFLLPINDKI